MHLFLFDIDGTLVTARGAGRTAFNRALLEVFGTVGPAEVGYDFRGRTDLRILYDLMGAAGFGAEEIARRTQACFAAYARELALVIEDGAPVEILPGIPELVRALATREDAVVGLLTGNTEAGAAIKLASTGLWPLFRVGAYGSDDADRRRLPAIACGRAEALVGRAFPFERVTIIGDTPLDVDCARACGARAVAVATGFYPYEALEDCRPDLIFKDLADVAGVIERFLSATEHGGPATPDPQTPRA